MAANDVSNLMHLSILPELSFLDFEVDKFSLPFFLWHFCPFPLSIFLHQGLESKMSQHDKRDLAVSDSLIAHAQPSSGTRFLALCTKVFSSSIQCDCNWWRLWGACRDRLSLHCYHMWKVPFSRGLAHFRCHSNIKQVRDTKEAFSVKWATPGQNQQNGLCTQRRLRSAWAFAQSHQSLRCPHEESLGP